MAWIDCPGGRMNIPTEPEEVDAVREAMAYHEAANTVCDTALWGWLQLCDTLIAWRVVNWGDPPFVLYMADEHERFMLWADEIGEEFYEYGG